MSHTYFQDGIECPECGYLAYELYHAATERTGQSVLMCEGCHKESLYDEDND